MEALAPTRIRKWLRWGALTLLVPGAMGCRTVGWETVIPVEGSRPRAVVPVPTAAEKAAAEHVTADKIYTVYSQNLIEGANPAQRFYDRLVWVTGVFNGVNRGLPGWTYLELRTHDREGFAYAALAPDAASMMAGLTPGTTVELLCKGAGAAGGDPLLVECRPR